MIFWCIMTDVRLSFNICLWLLYVCVSAVKLTAIVTQRSKVTPRYVSSSQTRLAPSHCNSDSTFYLYFQLFPLRFCIYFLPHLAKAHSFPPESAKSFSTGSFSFSIGFLTDWTKTIGCELTFKNKSTDLSVARVWWQIPRGRPVTADMTRMCTDCQVRSLKLGGKRERREREWFKCVLKVLRMPLLWCTRP